MVRKATEKDLCRIAEIIVFSKRMAYRCFLNNDPLEFNKLQVVAVLDEIKTSKQLENYYVFDDGIVKGIIKLYFINDKLMIEQIFVDPFFQQNGIGTELINYAIKLANDKTIKEIDLFVYPQNDCAIKFYQNIGFIKNSEQSKDCNTKLPLIGYTLKL